MARTGNEGRRLMSRRPSRALGSMRPGVGCPSEAQMQSVVGVVLARGWVVVGRVGQGEGLLVAEWGRAALALGEQLGDVQPAVGAEWRRLGRAGAGERRAGGNTGDADRGAGGH